MTHATGDAATHLVYDVGMHTGQDTAYYLFRGCRVVAVEADPSLVAAARERFRDEIAEGRLTVVGAAIGPEDGEAVFYVCDGKSEWNSMDRESATRLGRTATEVPVQVRRFDGILREFGVPYFLKVDIEGFDHHCLEGIDAADPPAFVSVEMGGMDSLVRLRARGYTRFKLIAQHDDYLPLQAAPPGFKDWLRYQLRDHPGLIRVLGTPGSVREALSRRIRPVSRPREAGWTFPVGSSGPMAFESRGEWGSFDDTAFAWLNFRKGCSPYGKPTFSHWFDLHATR